MNVAGVSNGILCSEAGLSLTSERHSRSTRCMLKKTIYFLAKSYDVDRRPFWFAATRISQTWRTRLTVVSLVSFVLLRAFLLSVSERHTLGTSPGENPPSLLHTRWMGAGLGLDAMKKRLMLPLPVIEPRFLGCPVHSGQYDAYTIGDTGKR
jgi:hypothetical protein